MAFPTRRKAKKNDEISAQLISKQTRSMSSGINPYYDTFDDNNALNPLTKTISNKQKMKISKLRIRKTSSTKSSKSHSALSPIVSAPEDNNLISPQFSKTAYSSPVTPRDPNRLIPKLTSRKSEQLESPPPPGQSAGNLYTYFLCFIS